MPEYIERETLLNELSEELEDESPLYTKEQNELINMGLKIAMKDVKYSHAADVVEVVHSKWILYTDGSGECERCHMRQKDVWDFEDWQNFCGYCGAKMDGK